MAAGRPGRVGGPGAAASLSGLRAGPQPLGGDGARPEPCAGREPRALLRCWALGGGGWRSLYVPIVNGEESGSFALWRRLRVPRAAVPPGPTEGAPEEPSSSDTAR